MACVESDSFSTIQRILVKDVCMQTFKLFKSNFIIPGFQVVVWGKFGQCLNNLKTNFRASSRTIICPLTPLISGVCAMPLSTNLIFLTGSLRKLSLETMVTVLTILSHCRQAPSCTTSSRVGE